MGVLKWVRILEEILDRGSLLEQDLDRGSLLERDPFWERGFGPQNSQISH